MSELRIYEEHAIRHEQAYRAFSRSYALEHPKPKARAWYAGLPYLMVPFLIIAMSGIALSALRTAPLFADIARKTVGENLANVEAVLAVIVIEFTMVIIRYVMVMQQFQDGKEPKLAEWMQGGFWLAFAVAITANLYSSVKNLESLQNVIVYLDFGVALIVGFSAPVLAFISGDVLASLWARSDTIRRGFASEYKIAMDEWNETKERRWAARKGDYGVRIQVEPMRQQTPTLNETNQGDLSVQTADRQTQTDKTTRSGAGYKRESTATEQAYLWITQNPDRIGEPLRALADEIGVGKDAVAKARARWVAAQIATDNSTEMINEGRENDV